MIVGVRIRKRSLPASIRMDKGFFWMFKIVLQQMIIAERKELL